MQIEPVYGSGTYYCEYGDCDVIQTDESKGDVLFYDKYDNILCAEHVKITSD